MNHANVALFVPDAGCPHRCVFCNQRTISGESGRITARDVDEAAQRAMQCGVDPNNAEIAFFGGSFTAIDRQYMTELLEAAHMYVASGAFHGIRISTRPDAINTEILALLHDYGVTAIELGCQSMDDRVLQKAGRGHTAAQTAEACRAIRESGFELGVQMMTGLPGDDDETCMATAKSLIALKPETARIYPTLVLENTPLAALWRNGRYKPQTLDEAVCLCADLLALFQSNGVRVIRLGLHAAPDLEAGYLAGPMHPAFRELCAARLYQKAMEEKLLPLPKGEYRIFVGERYLSQAAGQKRSNLRYFEKQGYIIHLFTDPSVSQYQIQL